MSHSLIFDLGTTNFKAVLFDAAGQTVAISRRATPLHEPLPGRVEIEPNEFWATLLELCDELRGAAAEAYAKVQRVSFATQANSFLLLDENDLPITPILVWLDERVSDADVPEINDYSATGLPDVGRYSSSSKLKWIARHQPKVWARTQRVCFLSDYLTLLWTGEHLSAAGVAGLSGLLDIHDLSWRESALKEIGLTPFAMPRVVYAGSVASPFLPSIRQRLALPEACRFVVGCLDQYAAAYAADLINQPGVCETTGTVLATVRANRRFDPTLATRGIYQGPGCTKGVYFQMLFGNTSGKLLETFRNTHAPRLSWEQLDALAAAAYAPDATSAASGDHLGSQVLSIYRQVAEALRDQLDVLHPEHPVERLVSLGGGARSETWRRIKAELLGATPQKLLADEPTAYGVFRLLETTR